MKKVGIFALLGCLVTVGGVYAQWVYSQATAGQVSGSFKVTMAAVGNNSKKGLIKVDTTHVVLEIDCTYDSNGVATYVPQLVVTGDIPVTFVADTGADANVKENGIKMEWNLSVSTDWKYDVDGDGDLDEEIFTVDNTVWTPLGGGAATKATSITAGQIQNAITLNPAEDGFKLDTLEKFQKFQNELNAADKKFTITVREVAATI